MGCRAGQGPFSATVRREWDVKDLRRCGRLGEPSLPVVPDAHARRASTAIRDYSPPSARGAAPLQKGGSRSAIRNSHSSRPRRNAEAFRYKMQSAQAQRDCVPQPGGCVIGGGLENAGRQIGA